METKNRKANSTVHTVFTAVALALVICIFVFYADVTITLIRAAASAEREIAAATETLPEGSAGDEEAQKSNFKKALGNALGKITLIVIFLVCSIASAAAMMIFGGISAALSGTLIKRSTGKTNLFAKISLSVTVSLAAITLILLIPMLALIS